MDSFRIKIYDKRSNTIMSSEIINNKIVGLFRIVEIIDTFFYLYAYL